MHFYLHEYCHFVFKHYIKHYISLLKHYTLVCKEDVNRQRVPVRQIQIFSFSHDQVRRWRCSSLSSKTPEKQLYTMHIIGYVYLRE